MSKLTVTAALIAWFGATQIFAQLSGTIVGSPVYSARVYLDGNLSITGNPSFESGLEMAAGAPPANLSIVGTRASINVVAGTAAAPLRSISVTGPLTLTAPAYVNGEFRVAGSLSVSNKTTKIVAGSILIAGDLTLSSEGQTILETNGGDVTIAGNIYGPTNANVRGTLVIQAKNGGSFKFTGTKDSSVTVSTSSGSSVGAPMYPINMSLLTNLTTTPITVGFVITNPDGGGGSVTSRFLIRAIGPGLQRFGISGAENPTLTVNSRTPVIADDWSSTEESRIAVQDAISKSGAFPIDVGSKDAAVVVDLPPGSITVSAKLVDGSKAGQVIIEVYRVP